MKKAIFGLQEKRGPWTFKKTRKTRFRDIFKNPTFWIFNDFPITGPFGRKFYKKKSMKKAIFGLQEKPGPWTIGILRKTRFRDIFAFRVFGIFNDFPLTGPKNKNDSKIHQKKFYKKNARGPPPRPRGLGGGTPHSGRSPELNQPLKSQSRPKKNVNRERFSYAKGY